MNRNKLKAYAPQARRDFIQAVTDRAAHFGLMPKKIEPMTERGDVVLIAGNAFPKAVGEKRKKLEARIKKFGFDQTMEAMAYTWFNRLVAIRFMELHGYLEHGYRVLSTTKYTNDTKDGAGGAREGSFSPSSFRVVSVFRGSNPPDILEHAQHVDLPGLNPQKVIELKLDGTKAEELYRLLLVAQCNALHKALPFLFEAIVDETELLLPDHLLHSDSLIRKLVNEIDEEDWQPVEIIGWLYQFYISEKKDEVIGKVVASEDIPAATQLFTPNWIVKYLVQNTLGRQWLATYPQSSLRQQMEYYIEPAEQTPEVQEQLKAITPGSLNPEELTLLDPACGSGHILVEAYDLFKAIYLERGYRAKDIPALILQKNLFGLEIDDRAAQLAAFALLMKARADDRQLFQANGGRQPPGSPGPSIHPHVMALVETMDMDAAEIVAAVSGQWGLGRRKEAPPPPGHLFEKGAAPVRKRSVSLGISAPARSRLPDSEPTELLFKRDGQECPSSAEPQTPEDGPLTADIRQLIDLFAEARTFGSLIQIPPELAARLPRLEQRVHEAAAAKGELSSLVATKFRLVIEQACLLARQYDCVVANPPYMGGRGMMPALKSFAKDRFADAKADLFAMFMKRGLELTKPDEMMSMVTMQAWMFLSSFEELRSSLLSQATIWSMAHLGPRAFTEISGEIVQVTAFVIRHCVVSEYQAVYKRLIEGTEDEKIVGLTTSSAPTYTARQSDFRSIPGQPIAYWISERMRQCFRDGTPLGTITEPRQGMATTDNNQFLRLWHEVSHARIGFGCDSLSSARSSRMTWFPYNKGGSYRRWYGNNSCVVDYENDGERLKKVVKEKYREKEYAQGFTDERWDKLIEVWVLKNQQFYFRPSITWSFISSSYFGVRQSDPGFIFDVGGSSAFVDADSTTLFAGFMCSSVAFMLMKALNPTMNFQVENVAALPVLQPQLLARKSAIDPVVREAVQLSRTDWDSFETSWDFQTLPVLQDQGTDAPRSAGRTLAQSQAAADAEYLTRFQRMQQLEEENNRLFIDAYGLQDELSPAVPDDQITLYRPDREQDIQRLISYALGCLMGRYSLDQPGLIYAHSGNVDFEKICCLTPTPTDAAEKVLVLR